MVLRPRTRLQLRRAVVAAALGALFVPAVADAKPKLPVITKVAPKTADVGTKLTLQGKYFHRGKAKNSVLFRRDKGKALFVKADVSTTRKLTVIVPKKLEKYMLTKGGVALPTRFRLRVLASKLSKAYTRTKISPVIGPEKVKGDNSGGAGVPTSPDGDCDSDGVKNRTDADDDNDLLADALELSLVLDPCVGDTDGDGVEDGFEYQSAIDLNDDDYQSGNNVLPYPGKTPYANPLFADASTDYDGDSLSMATEYKLWKYTYEVNRTATRTLSPLSYSDGAQFSLSTIENGQRVPAMLAVNYSPPVAFSSWADASGYGRPHLYTLTGPRTRYQSASLFDMDRDGVVSSPERYYWGDDSGYVSDDVRDEDVDGLTNFDEDGGPMDASWWTTCYSGEPGFPIKYAATVPFDADTDGDGILDGADDQDFDDVPNIMELSRSLAGNVPRQGLLCQPASGDTPYTWSSSDKKIWVNPYNPCLPDPNSRTCPLHPVFGQGYPPFINDFKPYVLN